MKKLFAVLAMTVALTATAQEYYLVGNFNGWNTASHHFVADGQGNYTLQVDQLSTGFKVFENQAWRPVWYPAADDVTLEIGVPKTLIRDEVNDGPNLELPVGVLIAPATIVFNPTAATITVTGTEVAPDYFVTGSFTGWDTPGGSGTYKMTYEGGGVYSVVLNVVNFASQPTRVIIGPYGDWTNTYSLPGDAEPLTVGSVDVPLAKTVANVTQDILLDVPDGAYKLTATLGDAPKATLEVYPSDVAPEMKAVFIGNSITDFWDSNNPLFFADNRIINTGTSGETNTQILARFDADAINREPAVVAIISPLTNDIAQNQGPITVEQMMNDLTAMVDKAKAAGIEVILTSQLPCNSFYWAPQITDVAAKIAEVNTLSQAMAQEKGIFYVDLYQPLAGPAGELPAQYSNDGVHPNDAGYRIIEPIMLEALAQARAAAALNDDNNNESGIESIATTTGAAVKFYSLTGSVVTSPTSG